jgi:hypothetical protein
MMSRPVPPSVDVTLRFPVLVAVRAATAALFRESCAEVIVQVLLGCGMRVVIRYCQHVLRSQLDDGWEPNWDHAPTKYFAYIELHIKQRPDPHVRYNRKLYDRVLSDRKNRRQNV